MYIYNHSCVLYANELFSVFVHVISTTQKSALFWRFVDIKRGGGGGKVLFDI